MINYKKEKLIKKHLGVNTPEWVIQNCFVMLEEYDEHEFDNLDLDEDLKKESLTATSCKVPVPTSWEDVLDGFYVTYNDEIVNGEFKNKMILVFKQWLNENYELPEPKLNVCPYCGDTGIIVNDDGVNRICPCHY